MIDAKDAKIARMLQADARLPGTESPGDNRPRRARLLPPTEIARSLDLAEGAVRGARRVQCSRSTSTFDGEGTWAR